MPVCRARRLGQKLLGDPPAGSGPGPPSAEPRQRVFNGFLQAPGMDGDRKNRRKKKENLRNKSDSPKTHTRQQANAINKDLIAQK